MSTWEEIATTADGRLKRARVRAGWLVAQIGGPLAGKVTFFADPTHEWDGGVVELATA